MKQQKHASNAKSSNGKPIKKIGIVDPVDSRKRTLMDAEHNADEGKHGHNLEGSDQHREQYAAKQRVRKASEVGMDLGALIQASSECEPEDLPACQAAIWSVLAELMAAPASTTEDAQAFAVWAGRLNDARNDFASSDASAMHLIGYCHEKLQTRTIETLATITGLKPETFSGNETRILN